MNKPAIAFLDHPFHRKTRSSKFFVDLLAQNFDVHVFYIEDDPRALMQEIAESSYQIVVCWQTEFCAPYFLMRGMRVICVPMYDGVANAPDWYWFVMGQARFFSFSSSLHIRLKTLGIESYHLKYYNPSKINVPQVTFSELHGFFWQRRPEEGLSWKWAYNLLGETVKSLHIHNAPDTQDPEDWQPSPPSTVSRFTEDGSSYRAALEKSNIFLCSRFTEGIGMSMLEAMAHGMCVIAHDAPTASEYIANGVNGLLIDFNDMFNRRKKFSLSPTQAKQIGKSARASYLLGCEEWEKSSAKIPFLVQSAPAADLSLRERAFAPEYLAICRFAGNDFLHYLDLLLLLYRKGLSGKEAHSIGLRDRVKWYVRRFPGAKIAWNLVRRVFRIT